MDEHPNTTQEPQRRIRWTWFVILILVVVLVGVIALAIFGPTICCSINSNIINSL